GPPRRSPEVKVEWAAADRLDKLSLRDAVPGATPSGALAGVYRIPLEGDVDEKVPLSLDSEPQTAAAGGIAALASDLVLDGEGNVAFSSPPRPAGPGDDPFSTTLPEAQNAQTVNAAMMKTPFFSEVGPATFAQLLMKTR